MRKRFLIAFLAGFPVLATAQGVETDTSYYTPPSRQKPFLTPDPDQRPDSRLLYRKRVTDSGAILQNRFREAYSWHVAVEGGSRQDVSRLGNSFNGLITNPTATAWTWSGLLGYTYRNAWNVEFGYTRAPTHLNVTVASNPAPYRFMYRNNGYGIPLRVKWHVGATKRTVSNTGF